MAVILPRTGIDEAASVIRAGGIVAIPTDTVYGLAADPFRPEAVARLFRLKGRPENKPILLLAACRLQVEAVASRLPGAFERVAARFWPGPLTVVLPAAPNVPERVTGGTGTVAVRIPGSILTRRIIEAARRPVTGTSANRSGRPPARSAREVCEHFPGAELRVLDGGPAWSELPSTILDLTGEPRVLREGAVSAEMILCALG